MKMIEYDQFNFIKRLFTYFDEFGWGSRVLGKIGRHLKFLVKMFLKFEGKRMTWNNTSLINSTNFDRKV